MSLIQLLLHGSGNMVPVESSNLRAVGYDASSNTLFIEFRNNRLYAYESVPQMVHAELMLAPSKGRYHRKNIRSIYKYTRL